MIVRQWRGWAARTNANAYVEHFRSNVLPELTAIDGFLGASLLREDGAEELGYVVQTRWTSMAAIRAFAGDDVARAVVEPQAVAALVRYEPTVQHFHLVEDVTI
ncbi:antibiotic biosynthesis monooxygenase family protein [Azospirillum sp. A39]|uniref:antibiotic biosynthesis monooxygenase family protein n=1 Tax=Azospirillum sp. A39 TaxID=3462279 RepID=UPI004045A4B5